MRRLGSRNVAALLTERKLHVCAAATGCALALAALWPVLFHPGLPAYQHDWSWPFDSSAVLTGAFNHLSTWNPAGLGSPNALASSNVLHLIIALPALIVPGVVAAKITLGGCAGVAAFCMYFASVRIMRADPISGLAAALLYVTTPVLVNKIAAGHVAYWIAYAVMPLIAERAVRYAETDRSLRILAQISLLSAVCALQPQFAVFALVAVIAGTLKGGWRLALSAGAACLAGSVTVLLPTAFSFATAQPYVSALYPAPRTAWENGLSVGLPDALWMTKYVVPYFQAASWHNGIALITEVCAALAIAVIGGAHRRIFIAALILAGLFFTTGTLGPAAALWTYAFAHWQAAALFRESYNANALLALGYGFAIAAASRWRLVSPVALLIVVITALPLFAGGIGRAVPNVIPSDDVEMRERLRRFPPGRVAATPFDSPVTLDGRAPGGIDIAAPADLEHASLTEYPTLFPLTAFSLSHCYCESWFIQAMRSAGVTGLIERTNLRSADLSRQHFRAFHPRRLKTRTIEKVPGIAGFARVAVEQPLSFDRLHSPDTAALSTNLGPLPGTIGTPAIVLPSPDRERDDPRETWVSIDRWYALSADRLATVASGVTTLSREPLHMRAGLGHWWVLYAAQRPVRIRTQRGTAFLPASAHARWMRISGDRDFVFTPGGGAATIYRLARGRAEVPLGTFAQPRVALIDRPKPWHVEITLRDRAASPALLIFRERFSPQWVLHGAHVLWHGVAGGYANAFLIDGAQQRLSIVYAPQRGFLMLSVLSWLLQIALLCIGFRPRRTTA